MSHRTSNVLCRKTREGSDDRYLVITRSDTGEIALPGGRVEEGETTLQTAVRELLEETGIRMLDPVFLGQMTTEKVVITTYFATDWSGVLRASPEGEPSWVLEEDLYSDRARWPHYNREMIRLMRERAA
jgi:8-oxo-dGTP diphosphatase